MKLKLNPLVGGCLLLFFAASCGKKTNRLNYDSYGRAGASIQQVLHAIPCQAGLGPHRIVSNLHTPSPLSSPGSFQDVPLLPGRTNGQPQETYVGASELGDIIVVQKLTSGGAHVFLHLCEQRGLIMGGRHIVQANALGRIVTTSRPDCLVSEVTAANLQVLLGPFHDYPGVAFPLSFLRIEDMAPQLCQRSEYRGGHLPY